MIYDVNLAIYHHLYKVCQQSQLVTPACLPRAGPRRYAQYEMKIYSKEKVNREKNDIYKSDYLHTMLLRKMIWIKS